MSENGNFGFGKMVPGFDFLQSLAKGASQTIPQMPSLSNWVAPTLNVEELEKRIGELKAVHFWLDQNSKALGATIQALEVQKMTLATLKGMNFNMVEVANALKLKTADMMTGGMEKKAEPAESVSAAPKAASSKGDDKANGAAAGAAPVDPLAWWGALTQQFQEIAANAMKETTQKTAMDAARNMATGAAQDAMKAATSMAKGAMGMGKLTGVAPVKAKAARKAAPRKTASKTKSKAKGQ